jgi:hypothetical protein
MKSNNSSLAVVSLSIERFAALNIARLYYQGKLKIGANAVVRTKYLEDFGEYS